MRKNILLGLAIAAAIGASAGSAQTGVDQPLAMPPGDPAIKWQPCPPALPSGGCEIAVLHGNPAQPNADIFLRLPAGYEIPPHGHSSAERMILTSGTLKVKYKGAAEATMGAGSYAYGPPGVPHRATCVGTEACTLFIAFVGPLDVLPFDGSLD